VAVSNGPEMTIMIPTVKGTDQQVIVTAGKG